MFGEHLVCSLTVGRKGLNIEEEEGSVLLKVTLQLRVLKLSVWENYIYYA